MTNHEKHILLWDKLARTGDNHCVKKDVFYKLFPEEIGSESIAVKLHCWACQESVCSCGDDCPIDWGSEYCDNDGTLYMDWLESDSRDDRKLLASQIRDLPWRVKCE
jgi:hypothetical protein